MIKSEDKVDSAAAVEMKEVKFASESSSPTIPGPSERTSAPKMESPKKEERNTSTEARRGRIVVIGSGYAGLSTVNSLLSFDLDVRKWEVTLITGPTKGAFVHRVAMVRAATQLEDGMGADEEKWEDKGVIRLGKSWYGNGTMDDTGRRVIQASVVKIEVEKRGVCGEVVLDTNERVRYDYLVCAMGSVWKGHVGHPMEVDGEGWKAHFRDWRRKFASAKSVVVCGGGFVGIETVGEIKSYYPNTKVTLVHSDPTALLSSAYPLWWRTRLTARVKALKGVDIVLGDRVEDMQLGVGGSVKTKNGLSIAADLLVPTTGPTPNTTLLSRKVSPSLYSTDGGDDDEVLENKAGCVLTESTLQVKGHRNIFAVGDILHLPGEQKSAAKVGGHADIVARNVVGLTKGETAACVYKTPREVVIVALGRKHGYGFVDYFGGFALPDWFCTWVKSKGLILDIIKGKLYL